MLQAVLQVLLHLLILSKHSQQLQQTILHQHLLQTVQLHCNMSGIVKMLAMLRLLISWAVALLVLVAAIQFWTLLTSIYIGVTLVFR
jgi:phosphoribosyl-dephospho-CoA transferase